MKKKYLYMIIFAILLFVIQLSVSKAEIKHKIICVYEPGNICWIGDIKVEESCDSNLTSLGDIPITLPEGYISIDYYYIPNLSNNAVGFGVVDGLFQYDPNDLLAPSYYYEMAGQTEFTTYASWAAELKVRGITPPTL